jgi:murein DD-endopeptidase MepM/ murein hydrolase activator NlpD
VLKELFSSTKRVVIKIIPHHAESIYKLELSHRHVAVVAMAVAVFAAATVTFQIGAVRAADAQLRSLQTSERQQRQLLVAFSHKTQDMMRRLKALQRNERDIKRLTGIAMTPKSTVHPATAQHDRTAAAPHSPRPAARIGPVPMLSWWARARSWFSGGEDDGAVTFASESSELASLDADLDQTLAESATLKARATAVAAAKRAAVLAREQYLDAIPSMWPTDGYISSGFGYRTYPDVEFHPGLDIVNDYGSPIYATASGVVEESGWDPGGYGYKIAIDHGNGYETWYAHDSKLFVSAGETVRKGEEIALVGATGFATGPHCHYELLLWGQPIDPTPFLDGVPASLAAAR